MIVEILDYLDSVVLLRLIALADWYDKRQPKVRLTCSNTIICQCNRRSCLGKTIATSTYVRQIKAS